MKRVKEEFHTVDPSISIRFASPDKLAEKVFSYLDTGNQKVEPNI